MVYYLTFFFCLSGIGLVKSSKHCRFYNFGHPMMCRRTFKYGSLFEDLCFITLLGLIFLISEFGICQ